MSEALVHTVLVVDDDPWILAAATKILAALNCRVLTTAEPLRALPLIEWERVDVVVADLAMPSVDGLDLVHRARQLFPDVVRILLTGTATLGVALKAINEAEVFRILTKPIEAEELREAVREALRRREALRLAAARARAAARREAALRELERRNPGIGRASLQSGVHVIPEERVRELLARFRGSVVAGWAEAPALPDERVAALVEASNKREASIPPGFAEEMAALRADYAKTLPERLEELSRAVQLAREDPADDDRTRQVKALAHTLRGTAGTFGFRGLSAAAGRIEDAARRRLGQPGAASADGLADIEEGLLAARASLAQDA